MKYSGKYVKPSAPVPIGSIMMRIAAVLMCLVLLSLHLMSGLYAKYSSSGNSDDSARVAKFQVNVTGTPNAVSIDSKANNNGTYTITVTNESEVAVSYEILPVTPTSKNSGYNYDLGAITASFDSNSGTLAPGATSAAHTLTFTVDWAKFTQNVSGKDVTANLSFTVTVHVDQVD